MIEQGPKSAKASNSAGPAIPTPREMREAFRRFEQKYGAIEGTSRHRRSTAANRKPPTFPR